MSLSSTDVHFSYLPLAHIFERTMQVGLYHVGASVVFSSGNVKTLTEELKVAAPTIFIAVPRVLAKFQDGIMAKVSQADAMKQTVFKTAVDQKIANLASNTLDHPQWDVMVFAKVKANLGLANVRFLLTGGASISPALKNFFRAILGVPVLEGYGQTECCAALSLTSELDHSTSGHVGVPLPCCKVKLESVEEMGYRSTDKEHEGGELGSLLPLPR
jgi:long-chain acyl-CoA synthetase